MNQDERDTVATQFGVSTEQVERDHLISHLLAFLSRSFGDRIHFIGGTALARTHLPEGRLSEDIDLVAVGSRKEVARDLDIALPRSVARTHGRITVEPALSTTADTLPVLLRPLDGNPVRLQLLSPRDRVVWPTERRELVQRYTDAPPATLNVPTLPAFAASKTATWADRHAARDLWDLWALSGLGAIDANAATLFRRYGPTNKAPGRYIFQRAPSSAEWHAQLAGQTRLTISAVEALAAVRNAWQQAVSTDTQ
ncbi:nucleotidyl transferase AbiEii/AbiGii toxin family protein [Mycolicibacterium sp. HK-90]|uniref:nucleotidyl transferase AbiEii/AbiGii toxin family protein n=1 Tax=Mycolicibacterium sp. HK-90 TaxID=3056937 RepID=UPI002659B65F|nr:nucleotidyl transferase AbiEii/AbiGii toxin family protein [Mycolicibacterium sp. HK-90]WKG01478.1 nucleotidyl transferase AbiEii/AbiGii toxin family protein [Mycolicibacterium sp. HK-90]